MVVADTLPGLTEDKIFAAFAGYQLDCSPSGYGWFCDFVTSEGDDVLLSIESRSPSEVHFVWASVTDPVQISQRGTLEVLRVIARLPYTGSNPDAAVAWLEANYAPTGFTPKETDFGPGHFVLRVTGQQIGDLELRAPGY